MPWYSIYFHFGTKEMGKVYQSVASRTTMWNNLYDFRKRKLSSTCFAESSEITYFWWLKLFSILVHSFCLNITQPKQKQSSIFQNKTKLFVAKHSTPLMYMCLFVMWIAVRLMRSVTKSGKHNGKSIRHNHWIMNAVVYLNCKCVNCAVWSIFSVHLIRQRWCIFKVIENNSHTQTCTHRERKVDAKRQ